jgi:peptidoglycan/xylan/chitin deacetylase (PgdA/CDA1 family)
MARKESRDNLQSGSHFSRDAQPHARQSSGRTSSSKGRASTPRTQQGYRAPSSNPYMQSQSPISNNAAGYTPVRAGRQTRKKGVSRKKRLASIGVIVAIFAVIAIVFAVTWFNRSVSVTLNGSETQVRIGSSLQQVIADKDLAVTPGNLVSVTGNVLQTGEGNAYAATVDSNELSFDDAQAYRVKGGESIDITNGADVMEDYDVTQTEVQPKLEMDGSWGSVAYIAQWGKVGILENRTGKISGETVEGQEVQPVQNCIIKLTNPTPTDGRKLVALTFDDGPSTYTQTYLDILAKYGAKATFFCLGENISNYPEQAKAIVDAGCQIASHTESHSELTTLDASSLQAELTSTFTKIKDATGVSTTVIRPPYGEFTQRTWLNSGGKLSASILWTQDSEDWKLPGASTIVSNSLINITSGSIILMHDGGGNRDQDVQALPTLIEELQSEGYTFVTIDELLASDSSIPADIASGNATMPDGCVWPT